MESKIATVSENTENNEIFAATLEQALTVAGVGIYNLRYCLVLSLFLIAAILDPMGYAYVLPAAKCDLNMTDAQRGFIASIPYMGIVITSYPWGYLTDVNGRKTIIIWGSLVCGFFSMLAAFMPELISFIICKFISGLCIAGSSAIPYAFVGEIVPPRHKDLILSIINALQILGSAMVPAIAWAILPLQIHANFGLYTFRSWRLLNIVYGSLFIIASVLMMFGPESPKFLVTQGRHDKALQVLQTIYARNKGKSPESYPIKMLEMSDAEQNEKPGFLTSLKVQTLPLLKPPYIKWMALNSFLLFGIFATVNGLNIWVPDILNRVFTGGGSGLTACQVIHQRLNETAVIGECDDSIGTMTYMVHLIATSTCSVIAVAGSSTVKFLGKKAFIIIVFAVIGIFCALVSVVTYDILYTVFLSTINLAAMALGPINAYAVDIFPTQLRGMAITLCLSLGRVGSMSGTNIAGALLNLSCPATFYAFGGLLILCSLLSFLLPKTGSPHDSPKPMKLNTRL